MDFTHSRPPAYQQPAPPPHPAMAHLYNLYPYATGAGANVGVIRGLAASYCGTNGPDPVGYGQIPPRAFARPQKGSKYNNNKKGSKPTKVVQSAYCGACKIECTTQEVLKAHMQGKKHKKQLQKLQESITPKSTTNPAEKKEEKKRKDAPREEDLEMKKRKLLEGGAQPDEVKECAICNIVVNSQKVFDSHIAGSKHAKNMGRSMLKMLETLN